MRRVYIYFLPRKTVRQKTPCNQTLLRKNMLKFARMRRISNIAQFLGVSALLFLSRTSASATLKVVEYESIYNFSLPSAHAATLAQTEDGTLVCAFFGGPAEKSPNTAIFFARKRPGEKWTRPTEIANGKFGKDKRAAAWNPVLFVDDKRMYLFYKLGDSPRTWEGFAKVSDDNGKTWSKQFKLGDGLIGPTKNKPVKFRDMMIAPSSREFHASFGWSSCFEVKQGGNVAQIKVPGSIFCGAIQPAIVRMKDGTLKAFMRSRCGYVCQSSSKDGITWSAAERTEIPNPNSGLDAINLKDGSIALVCNPTREGRNEMALLISCDGGQTWEKGFSKRRKYPQEYPSIIESRDGKIHIIYTRNRHISHIVLERADEK